MLEQLIKEYPYLKKHRPTASFNKLTRVVINNDGSMTKTLSNLLEQSISVRILVEQQTEQIPYHIDLQQQIKLDQIIKPPYTYRQVVLQDPEQNQLIFASSIWNQNQYDYTMAQKSKPIGMQLIDSRVEYFREILEIFEIEVQGTRLLGRCYIIWNQNKPITYIEELILPYLDQQLQNG